MKIKIKSVEVDLASPWDGEEGIDPIEAAALAQVWAGAVKKAWTPLVGALEVTGTLPDDLDMRIYWWAQDFGLGDRSKKADALARKKLKEKVQEQLVELRYNIKEARESGLIDNTVEKYATEGHELWGDCIREAYEELSAEDLLDPLPVTQEELDELLKEGSKSE